MTLGQFHFMAFGFMTLLVFITPPGREKMAAFLGPIFESHNKVNLYHLFFNLKNISSTKFIDNRVSISFPAILQSQNLNQKKISN